MQNAALCLFLAVTSSVIGCKRKATSLATDAAVASASASAAAPTPTEPACRLWYAGKHLNPDSHKPDPRVLLANTSDHPLKRCDWDAYIYSKAGAQVARVPGSEEENPFPLAPHEGRHTGFWTNVDTALSNAGAGATCIFAAYHAEFSDGAPAWTGVRGGDVGPTPIPFEAPDCAFVGAAMVSVFGREIRTMHCANKTALLKEFEKATEPLYTSCSRDVASGKRPSRDDVSCLLRAYTAADVDACKLKGPPFEELRKTVGEVMDRASVTCSH